MLDLSYTATRCFGAVFLKLRCSVSHPGPCLNVDSGSKGRDRGPGVYVSNKLPGDANAANLGPHFECLCSKVWMIEHNVY